MKTLLRTLRWWFYCARYPVRTYHVTNGVLLPGEPGSKEHEMARRLIGVGPSEQSQMAVPLRWHERVQQWLFPSAPRPFKSSESRTFVTTTMSIRADWRDRLRFLATGRLRVQIVTYTDVLVNEAESHANFDVRPWCGE